MKNKGDFFYATWKIHKTVKNAKFAFLTYYMEDPESVPIDLSNAVVEQMAKEIGYSDDSTDMTELFTDAVEVELRVDGRPKGTTKQSVFEEIAEERNSDPERKEFADASHISKSYYSRKAKINKKNK